MPSLYETQGLVAMEAMWFSKPVIVTNQIVSAEELVTHGENGYIVDAFSEDDLTGRLMKLSANPDLCSKMGEAGRLRANDYRPEVVMKELENVYQKLCSQPTKAKAFSESRDSEVFATRFQNEPIATQP